MGDSTAALGTLLKLLERGIVTGGDVSEVVAHLSVVVRADAVAAGQGYRFAPWSVLEGMPEAWIAAHARYIHQDNVARSVQEAAPGAWHYVDDSTDEEKDSDIYDRFCEHFGDGAVVRMYSPFVSDLHFVLYRERKQRFRERERVVLRALYPHLALGLATQRALAALHASETETIDAALRTVAGHATIAFPSRVVTWSPRAKAFWRRRLEVGARGWHRLDRMLLRAYERFEAGWLEARSQVLLPGVRVEFANVTPAANERRRLLCLLVTDALVTDAPATNTQRGADDEGSPTRRAAPAEALLSGRQREVARRLAAGRSIPEVARELGISTETVRGHRDEIYLRLGVRSRVELSAALR